jgi:hypothetical protein
MVIIGIIIATLATVVMVTLPDPPETPQMTNTCTKDEARPETPPTKKKKTTLARGRGANGDN